MPQFPSNGPSRKRSAFSPPSPDPGGSSSIFTVGFPPGTASTGDSRRDPPSSASSSAHPPDLSKKATEPFPDRLFRLPMPDGLIGQMPEMTDSALRTLLALMRLSFRFEPEKSTWVCPDRAFTRAEIEKKSGLSGQGVRNGLKELEERGYVSIDRSGREYEHVLEVDIPKRRYTYVPTGFLEKASSLSGTELRLVLAILRATWGWTTNSAKESGTTEHKRWAQLSTSALARLTGRSETAVKKAARNLQGSWFQRRRPTSGAYYYRFRSEVLLAETAAIGPEESPSADRRPTVRVKATAVFSMGIPNDLPPDRQQSAPPHRGTIESSSKRSAKHTARNKQAKRDREQPASPNRNPAVLGSENPPRGSTEQSDQRPQARKARPKQETHRGPGDGPVQSNRVSLTGLSPQKQKLGQKLANAGVWPSAIPGLLGRFSVERIEANFELFRERAPEVQNQGAWLRTAIEEGYALPSATETPPVEAGKDATGRKIGSSSSSGTDRSESDRETDLGIPDPGTKVSEARKQNLLQAGLAEEEDFERFAHYDDPGERQHFFRIEKTPSPASRQ